MSGADSGRQKPAARTGRPRPGAPARIVLVDDDADFLEMNRSVLESAGYAVSCYADPRAALEAMKADPPALLVTDLMMSALDAGFSLARAVKAEPGLSGVPVVIVTAAASRAGFNFRPRTPKDLEAMSADAFFDKPVAPDALLAKVKELLEHPDRARGAEGGRGVEGARGAEGAHGAEGARNTEGAPPR